MCELFGFSGICSVKMNPYLSEFFSHSEKHPHGWGMALLHGNETNLEKEPVTASTSSYLRERLAHPLYASNMMAHIRLATLGGLAYGNSHPFVQRDNSDRTWTLIHNGTILDCPALEAYRESQEGRTDSERILCHIISRMNRLQRELGHAPDAAERFTEMDAIMQEITPGNKVNLIIYDGEQFYIHTNMRETLYRKETDLGTFVATVPLDAEGWEPFPFMQLLGYADGKVVRRGTAHHNEFFQSMYDAILAVSDYALL